MAIRAFLQVGGKTEMVKKGDIIELYDGTKFTFMEMKRTKWVGKSHKDGKSYLIRSMAKTICGFDDTINEKNVSISNLKKGELFALDGKKESFMFQSTMPNGKIKAINIADGSNWSIDPSFTLKKIDINKLKEQIA